MKSLVYHGVICSCILYKLLVLILKRNILNKGLRIANDIVVQAWKAMVVGDSFMKAGWVHDMRAHVFSHQNEERILVMGIIR